MRRTLSAALTTAGLTVILAPALIALPVVSGRGADPRPIPPVIDTVAVSGVDAAALAADPLPPLPASPGAGPAAGKVGTAPVVFTPRRTTRPFDLVALTWRPGSAPAGTSIAVRVREQGAWSEWNLLPADDDGPDDGTAEAAAAAGREGTVPLLAAAADGVQLRVDSPTGAAPQDVTMDLIQAGESAADAGPVTPAASAAAATPRPGIITRAQWGADERLVKAAPVILTSVRTLVVHHTAGSNTYSSASAAAQVRSIYAYHTKVRGWNDIGYNFLVDRYGRVYEGRRGSLTSAVMGAHTGGFNSSSLGISVLGTFTAAAPPAATVSSLRSLLAWQAAQYGINPRGSATVVSAGSSATKYKAGAKVTVKGIIGHRDLGLTACPGDAFHRTLPSLRSTVAARMVPGLSAPTVTGSPAVAGTGAVTFTATVPTRQRWWMQLRALDSTTILRSVSGTSTGTLRGVWDLRDAAGVLVAPGSYSVTVITSSPVGTVPVWTSTVDVLPGVDPDPQSSPTATAKPPLDPPPTPALPPTPSTRPTPEVTTAPVNPVARVATADPAETSVLAGRLSWPQARTVVLVNGTGTTAVTHSLAAAPLAVAVRAPLLLTGQTELPAVVRADLTARRVTGAYLVGPVSVIDPAVETQLRALGVTAITRFGGDQPAATAAAVAAKIGAPGGRAVLAPSDPGELLDTLVAASAAASAGQPVLLTAKTGIPAVTLETLRALNVTSLTVVGSSVAVPETTLGPISMATVPRPAVGSLVAAGVTSRTRVIGVDRWATATAIAAHFSAWLPTDRVVLASGREAAADLLVASGQGRTILLTDATALPRATTTWLTAHRPAQVTLIAAPAAVASTVLTQVRLALG